MSVNSLPIFALVRRVLITSLWLAALSSVSPVLSAADENLDALLFQSSNLLNAGLAAEALALLQANEAQHGGELEFVNNLAVAYLGSGQAEKALLRFRELISSDARYGIISHNFLEMELQLAGVGPDSLKPLLFAQTVKSYEQEQTLASIPDVVEPAPSAVDSSLGLQRCLGQPASQ